MAIITFWNDGKVETGQSMTMAAIATNLAIRYDYKILMINTKYKDLSLERAFEPKNTVNKIFTKGKMDLGTGISGIAKAIMSNKIAPEIITNYSKIILKNLELLTERNVAQEDFDRYIVYLKDIINLANKYFDIVLVDIEGPIEEQQIKEILEMSTVRVVTLTQNLNVIDDFVNQREKAQILKEPNKIISIGRYDEKSKYTEKNVSRYIKEKYVFGIPYNTMFSMDASEGRLADYLIRFRKINQTNINIGFVSSIIRETEEIVRMVKEAQRKIY